MASLDLLFSKKIFLGSVKIRRCFIQTLDPKTYEVLYFY